MLLGGRTCLAARWPRRLGRPPARTRRADRRPDLAASVDGLGRDTFPATYSPGWRGQRPATSPSATGRTAIRATSTPSSWSSPASPPCRTARVGLRPVRQRPAPHLVRPIDAERVALLSRRSGHSGHRPRPAGAGIAAISAATSARRPQTGVAGQPLQEAGGDVGQPARPARRRGRASSRADPPVARPPGRRSCGIPAASAVSTRAGTAVVHDAGGCGEHGGERQPVRRSHVRRQWPAGDPRSGRTSTISTSAPAATLDHPRSSAGRAADRPPCCGRPASRGAPRAG